MNALRAVKRRYSPPQTAVWEIVPGGWAAVQKNTSIRGWNVTSAVDASVKRAVMVTAGLQDHLPFGLNRSTVNSPSTAVDVHNTAESFVHSLLSSTRTLRRAKVLDWGGGVGHYYEICRAVAPELELEYHCTELPEFVRRGRELYPEVVFHDDEGWKAHHYDFVFSSGATQYLEDLKAHLRSLAEVARGGRLLVTRLPVVFQAPSFVCVQRPHAWGFGTEYASWCHNRETVLSTARELGLTLVWEFALGEHIAVTGAPEVAETRGFLFDVPRDLK